MSFTLRFTPEERASGIHYIGGWVGCCLCRELNCNTASPGSSSLSLCQLSYPGLRLHNRMQLYTHFCNFQAQAVAVSVPQQGIEKTHVCKIAAGEEWNVVGWEHNCPSLMSLPSGGLPAAYKCEGRSCLGRIASIPRPPPRTCLPACQTNCSVSRLCLPAQKNA